jgi:hypothetical protein
MILTRRRPVFSHWANYGCLTLNIADMTGQTDAAQETYLTLVKQAFPVTDGKAEWIRQGRTGIDATTAVPNWDTNATRYWPNMYFRSAAADVITGRKLMFEPTLWVRPGAGSFTCNPNAGPNYFGRNSAGVITVVDASNTWRRDIRLNLDRLCWEDVT